MRVGLAETLEVPGTLPTSAARTRRPPRQRTCTLSKPGEAAAANTAELNRRTCGKAGERGTPDLAGKSGAAAWHFIASREMRVDAARPGRQLPAGGADLDRLNTAAHRGRNRKAAAAETTPT